MEDVTISNTIVKTTDNDADVEDPVLKLLVAVVDGLSMLLLLFFTVLAVGEHVGILVGALVGEADGDALTQMLESQFRDSQSEF